jgi:hypothetical protein
MQSLHGCTHSKAIAAGLLMLQHRANRTRPGFLRANGSLPDMQKHIPTSVTGSPFNDALLFLHEHAFTGVPGESDPFTLTILNREYVAFALSCYYQCDHCQSHHHKMIEKLLKKEGLHWKWEHEVVKTVLFLRTEKRNISAVEWEHWQIEWDKYAQVMCSMQPGLIYHIAYAIGFARDDKDLLDFAWQAMASKHDNVETLRGVIRDIVRVAIFMKAATSKNRVEPIIMAQFASLKADAGE